MILSIGNRFSGIPPRGKLGEGQALRMAVETALTRLKQEHG
jgi:hypothetical protein